VAPSATRPSHRRLLRVSARRPGPARVGRRACPCGGHRRRHHVRPQGENRMSAGLLATVAGGVFICPFLLAWGIATRRSRELEKNAASQAQTLLEAARSEADNTKRDALIEAKETVFRAKQEAEKEAKSHRDELAKHEEALAQREVNVEKK